LSRDAKPPSLSLITSNGSTAIVPPTPVVPSQVQAQAVPWPATAANKDLPSPPPPPPVKSERRSNVGTTSSGLKQSKSQQDLARNDSLLSQESKSPKTERPATVEAVPSVKRKALPAPAAKKFLGLGQLGTGPRGGKGGPLPPTSAPRKSVREQASRLEQEGNAQIKEQANRAQSNSAPAVNELPPTPDEDKFVVAAPVPPRKALGLPSNPRARGGPISPMHVRGKSSTGFGLLKVRIQISFPPPVLIR
jgi:hypothetical protein